MALDLDPHARIDQSLDLDQRGGRQIVAEIRDAARVDLKPYFIRAEWDDEALVWSRPATMCPGSRPNADTLEALVQKLKIMVPELLAANGITGDGDVTFELLTRRFAIARAAA